MGRSLTARFSRAVKLGAAVAAVVIGVALAALAPAWTVDKLNAGLDHLVGAGAAAGHWLDDLVRNITQ